MTTRDMLRFYGAGFAGVLIAVALTCAAWAHDHANAANDGWLAGLTNANGGVCCNGDDTTMDVTWSFSNSEDFPYRVKREGKELPVSKGAVVKGHNKMGIGLAWFGFSQGEPYVRCFMPGTTA